MNHPSPRVRTLPTRWREIILVCGKCSRKIHGGFGPDGDMRIDKALRRALGICKGRRGQVGFARVACFDVCPKNAVVVARAGDPGRLQLIPCGMPVGDVAALLDLAAGRLRAWTRACSPIDRRRGRQGQG